MMKKLIFHTMACVLVFTGFCLAQADGHSQEIPPIRPAIESESGSRRITVSNVTQDAPVTVSATRRLADRAYGSGFMTVTNADDHPIAGIGGAWIIRTARGGVLRHAWDLGGPTSLWDGGIKHGKEVEVPVAGPPNQAVDGSDSIAEFSVIITGIAYVDRTWWGPDGFDVRRKLETDVRNMLMVVDRLTALARSYSPEEFAQRMRDSRFDPALRGEALFPSPQYQGVFHHVLLEKDGSPCQDPVSRLGSIRLSLVTFLS